MTTEQVADTGQQAGQQQSAAQQAAANGTQQAPLAEGTFEHFIQRVPEQFRGKDPLETLGKVFPAFEGYHKAQHERGPKLAKPEDLVLDITNEKAKPFFDAKSPMATAFSKAAVEVGLTGKEAGKLANAVMGQLAESGALQDPVNPLAIVTAQAKALGFETLDDKAKTALDTASKEMTAWAETTAKQLGLDEEATDELASMALTPGGFKALRALMGQDGKGGMRLGGEQAQGVTKETVLAELNDPRYNSLDPKFDPKFRKQVDEKWAALSKGSR